MSNEPSMREFKEFEDEPLRRGDPAVEGDAVQDGVDTPEDMAEARVQGWRPESEWDDERAEREGRRKPPRFLSAREFLYKTRGSNTFLRERLETITRKLTTVEEQNRGMHQAFQDQRRLTQQGIARAFQNGMEQASLDMRKAVEQGRHRGL